MIKLISKAYTNLSTEIAASLLGEIMMNLEGLLSELGIK